MNIKNKNGLVHFLDHLTIRIIPRMITARSMIAITMQEHLLFRCRSSTYVSQCLPSPVFLRPSLRALHSLECCSRFYPATTPARSPDCSAPCTNHWVSIPIELFLIFTRFSPRLPSAPTIVVPRPTSCPPYILGHRLSQPLAPRTTLL